MSLLGKKFTKKVRNKLKGDPWELPYIPVLLEDYIFDNSYGAIEISETIGDSIQEEVFRNISIKKLFVYIK